MIVGIISFVPYRHHDNKKEDDICSLECADIGMINNASQKAKQNNIKEWVKEGTSSKLLSHWNDGGHFERKQNERNNMVRDVRGKVIV